MIRVIDNTNPCKCGNGGDCPWYRTTDEGNHILTCTHCGHGHFDGDLQKLIDRWNEDNPLPEPSKDWTWQQVQELTQAGKMGEAVALYTSKNVTIPIPTTLDTILCHFVRKTADELPDPLVDVLGWVDGAWQSMYISGIDSDWYCYDNYWQQSEVKYWLPLPTFNPESET